MAGAAIIASGAFLTGCDDIDDQDRLIPVERPTVERVVLAMDFTGMRCVNCPNAAETLHNIMAKYPGSVIVVGIHAEAASDFTLPIGTLDLRSKVSDVYYNYFKPAALPSASINGATVLSGTQLAEWTKAIDDDIAKPAPADVDLTTSYDATSRELKVNYKVTFNQMHEKETGILLWLTESGIVGPQMSTSGFIRDYEHNHVLRTSLNGDWGETLGSSFVTEQVCEGEATLKLDAAWKAENCEVVGFIFNTADKGVQQAASAHVVAE